MHRLDDGAELTDSTNEPGLREDLYVEPIAAQLPLDALLAAGLEGHNGWNDTASTEPGQQFSKGHLRPALAEGFDHVHDAHGVGLALAEPACRCASA
jgi:hypothetical protein